jgi:hypothetical protein
MFEKVIPVIIALIALQFLIRFMNKRRASKPVQTRTQDYKKRIDEFLRVSNFDEGANSDRILTDEIRSGLGKPELMLEIPDSMRDVRRNLNLIIDAVTHGVKSKIGSNPASEIKYSSPDKMFEEIVAVINRHKVQ